MSHRTVRLPQALVMRLLMWRAHLDFNEWAVAFISPLGKLRDSSSTSHHMRDILNETGHPWASAPTFRTSVATMLDGAGASGREAANQLGHAKPSMTTDVYMSRRTVTERAAEIL